MFFLTASSSKTDSTTTSDFSRASRSESTTWIRPMSSSTSGFRR